VHYTELFVGFVGRSLTKPAQIVDIFLSAWDFSLHTYFRAVKDWYLCRCRSASFPTHGFLWICPILTLYYSHFPPCVLRADEI
jgi:hypothetical protein